MICKVPHHTSVSIQLLLKPGRPDMAVDFFCVTQHSPPSPSPHRPCETSETIILFASGMGAHCHRFLHCTSLEKRLMQVRRNCYQMTLTFNLQTLMKGSESLLHCETLTCDLNGTLHFADHVSKIWT